MNVYLCNAPESAAGRLATTLVQEHLSACVNLLPSATSVYEWEGTIETQTETVMIIKSASPAEDIIARILELHPYDTPEIVCLGIDSSRSHKAYIDWVAAASTAGA